MGGTGRSRGRGFYNQDILHERNMLIYVRYINERQKGSGPGREELREVEEEEIIIRMYYMRRESYNKMEKYKL